MAAPGLNPRRWGLTLALFVWTALGMVGAATAQSAIADPNPAAAGPFPVRHVNYTAGRIALTLPKKKGVSATFTQPLRGSVSYPAGGGNWPVAVFLHGRHGTCIDRRGQDSIPVPGEDDTNCPDRKGKDGKLHERWIRSYAGYRYIADRLASQGYLVVSADANRIASYEYFSVTAGIRARAQLVGATLDLIRRWDGGTEKLVPEGKGASAAIDLSGRPDLGNIALMGHSRGGDGVTQFIAFNQKRSTIYPLNGVVAIAPTDLSGDNPMRFGGTNLAELLPACDGDVSDQQGGRVFERVKNSPEGRSFSKYQWLLGGANHNWFNTVWKGDDNTYSPANYFDSVCGPNSDRPTRLSRAGQRSAGLHLIAGFVRTYAGGESQFSPGLEFGSQLPGMRASYIAPNVVRRLVIGPAAKSTVTRNNLGGAIHKRGLKLSWCNPRENRHWKQVRKCPGYTTGSESTINRSWTRQLVIGWKRKSHLTTELPPVAADASAYRDLVFRAVTTLSPLNSSPAGQRVDVVLVDHAGHRFSLPAESYSPALRSPVGDRTRQLILSDIRVPLADFTGVDLTDLASIRLEFGNRGRTRGQVQIADLAFQGSPGPIQSAAKQSGPAQTPVAGPGTAADAILTATSAGTPQPGSDCQVEPSSTVVSRPAINDGILTVTGQIHSPGCAARVQVSLFEREGSQCRFVSSEGEYGQLADCSHPYSLVPEVGADGSWSLSIPWTEGPDAPDLKLATIPI